MFNDFNVDRSRELRLWITQIIVPIGLTCYIFKDNIKEAINNAKIEIRKKGE